MTTRPADLPDFKNPPVTEVALSIQFSTLEQFKTVHAGLLWQRFKSDFPKTAEHAPLPAVFETFGLPQDQERQERMAVEFQMLNVPPVPRYWFIGKDDSELIQFQADKFAHNWRKRGADHDYPRYETIVKRFRDEIYLLADFLKEHELGAITPNQCEVTYINQIELDKTFGSPKQNFHRVFTIWKTEYSDANLPTVEAARFSTRFVLRDRLEKPYGRLHFEAYPGRRKDDGQEIIMLSITARGKPDDGSVDAALKMLDAEREAVVKGFASITTKEMHKRWGRKDA